MDGICLAVGTVGGEGSTRGGGMKAEDLSKVAWSVDVDSGSDLRKL